MYIGTAHPPSIGNSDRSICVHYSQQLVIAQARDSVLASVLASTAKILPAWHRSRACISARASVLAVVLATPVLN